MKTTPDYELAPYLAAGRQLRSQAFLSTCRGIRDWIKGTMVAMPKAAGRPQNV